MLTGKTILIVDDDPRNIFALSAVLKSMGITIVSVESGQECIEMLTNNYTAVDLVLMDIMMPVMDGYQTMKLLRENDYLKEIPIIALTAHAMIGDDIKCFEAGANEYCSKPVDIDDLTPLMEKYLKV